MNVRIEIDTKTFVRFWLVVIGFILAALMIYSARSALYIVGSAFFLAIALNPPVSKIAKLLPSKSRLLSTALAYIAVIGFLAVIAFLVIPPISQQTIKFAQNVPNLIDAASDQYVGIDDFVKKYSLQNEYSDVVTSIKDAASNFATGAGSLIINSINSILLIFTAGILIFVLSFLMLVEGPDWFDLIWSSYSNKNKMYHHKKMLGRMNGVVTGYVVGQLSISSIAGIVSGLSVFILSIFFGAPTNLIVPAAAIIFVFSLIPLFGEMIGTVLVSFLLLLNSVPSALIFLVFFIIYQQLEGNYISPKIQSKRIDLSALAILVSVTLGIYILGITGAIISIPIAGCVRVFVEEYQRYARSERNIADKEEKKKELLNL